VKDFKVTIAGSGAGGRRKAERSVASVGGIVIVVNLGGIQLKKFVEEILLFPPDIRSIPISYWERVAKDCPAHYHTRHS
jgi:hypothetical protein